MQPVVGVFMHRADAERLMEPLQALGVPKKHLSLLSPCFPEEIETVPMMDTERPLIGTVLGGLVGFALSGGGSLLGAELLGIVIPGVGPILTVGTVAVALLATAGAVGGAEVGSGGVPRHEMGLIMPHPEGQEAERPNSEEETAAVVRHHGAEHLGMGAVLGGIGGLVVGLSTLVIPGFGPMIVAGPLAIALAGAGVGAYAGVIAGSLIHLGVSEQEAGHYAEGLRRGGALVVVQLPPDLADRAEGIMNRHQPVNLEERVSH